MPTIKGSRRTALCHFAQLSLVLVLLLTSVGVSAADSGGGKGRHHEVQPAPVELKGPPSQPLHPPTGRGKLKQHEMPPPQAPGSASSVTPDVTEPLTGTLEALPAPVAPEAAAITNPVIDMKLLVIAADANSNTNYPAIKAFLDQLGIPYNTLIANQTTLTPAFLSDGASHGYYAGIILDNGALTYEVDPHNWPTAFDSTEWDALWAYEASFGIRQITYYTAPFGYPDTYGLTLVSSVDTAGSPLQASLTDAGKQVYPYLNPTNPITFRNAWVYLATPTDGTTTPLLTSGNYAIASIHSYPDGRQNLAVTADNNPYLIHSMLLSYGNINWVTKGIFLGERHAYLSPQVDDLLEEDDVWNTVALTDTTGLTFRMTGADYAATIAWQQRARGGAGPATTCVTRQPDQTADKDTFILQEKVDENHGNDDKLKTDSEIGKRIRTLIQFDLSAASGKIVDRAQLSLYLYNNSGSQNDVVEAHQVTRAWTEGTGGSNTGATWKRYDGVTGHAWTTAGGDYDSAVAGSFVASGKGWKTLDLTSVAQAWANGTANNGVILLSAPASGNNEKVYYSGRSSNASLRPKLDLCYHDPGATVPPVSSNAALLMLSMAFNGEGTSGIYSPDTLTPAVTQNSAPFGWINHTYHHANLDAIEYDVAKTELSQNDKVAHDQLKLANYVKDALVQPDISGLTNPEFQYAAWDFGIRYMISDTSRKGWGNPSPNAGIWATTETDILVVPRLPTNLFYNLTTPEEFTSEYNCYYGPSAKCANGQWKYWDSNLSYDEILDKESDMMLSYLLKWNLDPLMFHQPNLRAYNGVSSLLGDLVDATLAKYNSMVNLPILSPGLHDTGVRMANRMAYNAAGMKATLKPCSSITVRVAGDATIPVTGVNYGTNVETYGGQTISYIKLSAGDSVTVPVSCQ